MTNPMRYIRDLEAVGFQRNQAEAQVQIVLDALDSNLATKIDVALLKSDLAQFRGDVSGEIAEVRNSIAQLASNVSGEIAEVRNSIAQLASNVSGEIAKVKSGIAQLNGEVTVLKNDMSSLRNELKSELTLHMERTENRSRQFEDKIVHLLQQFQEHSSRRFAEIELRLVTRLGLITVSSTSLAVALISWFVQK